MCVSDDIRMHGGHLQEIKSKIVCVRGNSLDIPSQIFAKRVWRHLIKHVKINNLVCQCFYFCFIHACVYYDEWDMAVEDL